jgi:hypothetical protein
MKKTVLFALLLTSPYCITMESQYSETYKSQYVMEYNEAARKTQALSFAIKTKILEGLLRQEQQKNLLPDVINGRSDALMDLILRQPNRLEK